MDYLDNYRGMQYSELIEQNIITQYQRLFTGERKVLPKGTWKVDKNVIIIIRYVLEVKLELTKAEVPKINRTFIAEQKLWGAINRFKSIKKLLYFVYPNEFDAFDFKRVPKNYWENVDNIKHRLEYYLKKNNYLITDIPTVVTYDQLVEWGFSNPLKRHGHSPYHLINTLYPGKFDQYEFRKVPQGSTKDKTIVLEKFFEMLEEEKIVFKEIPKMVTQQMLNKHRLSGALKHYNNSPSTIIQSLFPNQFNSNEFIKANRYWENKSNVKNAILEIIKKYNIPHEEIPQTITKKLLADNELGGLLHHYNGSPIEIINLCFPNEFLITDFTRVPNRYWYSKENRVDALRTFCKKRNFTRKQIANLSRAYFHKHFPRFVSIIDRHYESKLYLWINEAFPEHVFTPEEFNLHIGLDGQLCDSKEELIIHNFLTSNLINANVQRESIRLVNVEENETYIPDWIIEQNGDKYIVEYFGLYNSDRFPGYTERVDRKVHYYNKLKDYKTISIFPDDFRKTNYSGIIEVLKNEGLILDTTELS